MKEILDLLLKRILDYIKLSVPKDKLIQVEDLLNRHVDELLQKVESNSSPEFIESRFKNFMNKSLSTIEALGLEEKQYKAVRKLVLSEINGCLEMVVKNMNKEE